MCGIVGQLRQQAETEKPTVWEVAGTPDLSGASGTSSVSKPAARKAADGSDTCDEHATKGMDASSLTFWAVSGEAPHDL
jgi:hypothetical protein